MSLIEVNDQNFKVEVLDASLPVLVDFWAPWCGPCSAVAPVVEEIAGAYEGKLRVCRVNVDESPNSASQYGVMSIPTLVVFKGGKELDRVVGAVPRSKIDEKIKPHV